jgi:NAD(P)-dependent dehydrogenase (short-subunit alcohol dehydrogenase family)
MNLFSVEDKIILVSGGSRGLGKEMAIGLAQHGAHVVIAARNERALEETAEYIRSQNNQCEYVFMDVASEEGVREAVKLAQEKAGGTIDVLINNAGMSADNVKAEDMDEADWQRVLDVNLDGYFRLGKAVVKGMIAKGGGKIINMSSVLSTNPIPLAVAYCVSKGAINHLTRAWALEWSRYNIQVNALAPSYILSDINREHLSNEKFMNKILSRIPAGRIGNPGDLIGAVIFLASGASGYITGAVLPVDGGWSAT